VVESSQHQKLLARLVTFVASEFTLLYSLVITDDLPKPIGSQKPPLISGYRPDLYGADAPVTTVIIGEAKTSGDLETGHSMRQYRAFFAYLGDSPSGVLVISVEWNSMAAARRVFKKLKKELPGNRVKVIVVDETRAFYV
jgi:hypothetical protein